jgi:uncharacterized SAM-binding protein YcdF (DUF218 family)
MFVFLSKLLPLLIYPLGLASLLLAASLVFHRHARLRGTLVVTALAVLWVCSTPWLAVSLARSLEWRYLPPAEFPHVEVIVLLGGGTDPGDYPRPGAEVNGAGDRVLYAARLYKEGKADHILLSGGNIDWLESRGSTPAQEMAEILALAGVPPEALWMQPSSQNTAEDAQYSRQLLDEQDLQRILLVTSAMHMPRSVALFEKQGFEVIPAPTDFSVTQKRWENLTEPNFQSQLINLLPSASNLGLTTNALKEYIGMLVYRLRGWL